MTIDEIKPYEKNAKKHPDKQLKQIADSLREFGWQQTIVVDTNGVIIVGHGRYEAYKKFPEGIAEPRIEVASLTDEQAKAYRLADNKLNESEWDMGLAIEELRELSEDMQVLTGFDLDLLLEADEKDDEIPTDVPPVANLGDLYKLGRHRLLCGDATKMEDVERLMGGALADMVFTDPPYNINYKGQGKNTSNTILADNVEEKEFDEFLKRVFASFAKFTKGGGGNYVFHASRTQAQFENALHSNGYEIKNQLIWNKPMAALGWGDYRWKHEPFFYAGKKGQSLQFYGDRTHSTVWDFQKSEQQLVNWAKKQKIAEQQGKTTVWSMKRDKVNEYVHPTQKPVELISYALTNSTKADDIVLDLFGGSGSTMIACEKMGRTGYLLELDPRYIDVIVKRWEDYTRLKAEKL
jgi:DNA modification methylase